MIDPSDSRGPAPRPGRRVPAAWLILPIAAALAACAGGLEPATASSAQATTGQCTRDETVLRGPQRDCTLDLDCPCGSFCDAVEHTCRFQCMVPPASPAEACATGSQCDDTGRCVIAGSGPPATAPVLTARPPALTTAPGGAAQQAQVRLAVHTSTAVNAAQATAVRATGKDGIEVSCDAAVFGHECTLTGWTFAFDGAVYNAARPVWVRSVAGTPDGSGALELHIDATAADLVVPAGASSAGVSRDGAYAGTAVSAGTPGGVAVTAQIRGNLAIVRDRARIIAPDGALVLDVATAATPPTTPRRLTWLRAPGAADTAGAIVGDYQAGVATTDPTTASVRLPFTIALPGGDVESWTVALTRTGQAAAECAADTDCTSGSVCPAALGVCVPSAAWTPPTTAAGNLLDDPRSAQWWDAIDDLLGNGETVTGAAVPAFATTGANLIETLMCTTDPSDAGAGYLGAALARHSATEPSRSGDLACMSSGAPNLAPGAVGLMSRIDRTGVADVGSALLGSCVQDLARPPTSGFAANFAATTGACVNPARFLPALRLLATGELAKRTAAAGDRRTRTLLARLLQQWSQLHGFVASTGLAERDYDDAIAGTPAEARQNLLDLLDTLDAGSTAVLDRRVAALFPLASTWGSTATGDLQDYRTAKLPIVYWPFNAPGASVDVMRGVTLGQQVANASDTCKILDTRNSIAQNYFCPGFTATLPADAPSIAGGGDLSVVFALDPIATEFPTYIGGTIVATETLAIVQYPGYAFAVVHPTADGGTEWVPLAGIGDVGAFALEYHATALAVVRDSTAMTYTLYREDIPVAGQPPVIHVVTQPYSHPVGGRLSSLQPRQVLVGAGPPLTQGHEQWPHPQSYGGIIDDVAIFDSTLSRREFARYAQARAGVETAHAIWPLNVSAASYAAQTLDGWPTQELTTPIGAGLLETEAAQLDVVARLIDETNDLAQLACDNADPAALTDLDAIIARVGRSLRQGAVIEGFARSDTSDRATKARQLVAAKRSQVARGVHRLTDCVNPYAMTDHEIPLYFNNIDPSGDEKTAFFAASDYLRGLAEQRVAAASAALAAVQANWSAARSSQIQQQEADATRAQRVEELAARYGDELRRLCGISDRTADQIMQDVRTGAFSVDTCFVTPTPSCLAANASGPIMDADPTCYRGVLGGALMDMRAAYHAQQGAYDAWQAAIGNAEGSERLCVLEEMDAFGCSALDRHALSGVTCPPDHQGTIELIHQFNAELDADEHESSLLGTLETAVSTAVKFVASAMTDPGGAFLTATIKSLGTLGPVFTEVSDHRKRQHEQVLQVRAIEAGITECWSSSDQYQRAVAAAEQAASEAADKMQSATIAFQNSLADARETLLEAPVVDDRERTRPAIPIEFNYWLPAAISNYRFQLESARRYAYMALRAVEYDTQMSFTAPQPGAPSRGAVLGAWRPDTLSQQLSLMADQTSNRLNNSNGHAPALGHVTFDLGNQFLGVDGTDPAFGATLLAHARPVYSKLGEYLGLGVAFSYVPEAATDAPTWRCAERIWRVNVGASGIPPSSVVGMPHVKLLKRNLFASRACSDDGLQVSSLQPSQNLLIAAGDPQIYVDPATTTPADIPVVNFDTPNNQIIDFQDASADSFGVPSSELALQGLYGDYILLFPSTEFSGPRALDAMTDAIHQLDLRFDILSIDATPQVQLRRIGPNAITR